MEKNNSEDDNYVKPPSFLQMVKTFTAEMSTYIANGAPNVTTEDYIDRLGTCESCEHFIEKHARCGQCGCLMQHKAKMKTADCPLNKWEKQILTDDQKETLEKEQKRREEARIKGIKKPVVTYTPEEMQKLKEENAKRQEDNNTDSSNKV